MREFLTGRVAPFASALCLLISTSTQAAAQAPAAAPAPSAAPPAAAAFPAPAPPTAPAPAPPVAAPSPYPVGYPPPPPGYGYPAYGAYPAPLRVPESAPYTGGPVPSGFHIEERPRRGLIVSGAVVLGVPWLLGLAFASGSNYPNRSGWLVIPGLGPWLTLAARHNVGNCQYDSSNFENYDCPSVTDDAMRTLLIFDGLTQGAGAIMFVAGLASPKKVIARDFMGNLHFAPSPIGKTGYGGFVTGQF